MNIVIGICIGFVLGFIIALKIAYYLDTKYEEIKNGIYKDSKRRTK